jgi:type I restriction enzyme S subunit
MPVGTVLIAMYGATAGTVATLGIEAATNQAICAIEPGADLCEIYLAALLRHLTPFLVAKRVGGAQPNLSQNMIRRLEIPVPPIEQQHQYADRVAAVENLKESLAASLGGMDALFSSLQQRAFIGEL